ncbi:MAG TPA: bifunctional metallophosphatase/5'-nucleotidase [Burkholderiaceae bacterium]|nr:bifunctional metallophosphatase/5'-nucleotidase [Burkholderiaceae bacterium]
MPRPRSASAAAGRVRSLAIPPLAIPPLAIPLVAALVGCVPAAPDPGGPETAARSAPAASPRLRVIAFNDFHGQLEPPAGALRVPDPRRPGATLEVGAGGVAYLASAVRRLRAEVPDAVVVSAGDLVGASPLASALFRDEPTIEAMNAIGIDLNAVGNHELDRGVDELRRLAAGGCRAGDGGPASSCAGPDGRFAGARFPMVAANLLDAAGRPVFAPSVTRTVGGVTVAFVGAVTRTTPTIVSPAGIAGLRFVDEAEAINREVAALKAAHGVEAFVAVIHEGGRTAGDWNDPACPGASGEIFRIADRLRPEVDLVVSGHTHQGYHCVRDAPGNPGLRIVQAAANGRALAVVDLALDARSRDVDRRATTGRNLPVANGRGGDRAADGAFPPLPPDPALAALVDGWVERARPLAARVVGRLDAPANRVPSRGGDSALGRLVADAQLAATRDPARGGARLALTNPGGLREDLACEGTPCAVRFGDAFAAQPFGNALVVMTLTGAQLLAVLEQQFVGPNAQRPRLLQPSAGFGWRWRATPGADGRRIVDARLDGVPIDPAARYRVTVNDYLAAGGDGFDALREGTERVGGPLDVDALVALLGAGGTVEVPRAARLARIAE